MTEADDADETAGDGPEPTAQEWADADRQALAAANAAGARQRDARARPQDRRRRRRRAGGGDDRHPRHLRGPAQGRGRRSPSTRRPSPRTSTATGSSSAPTRSAAPRTSPSRPCLDGRRSSGGARAAAAADGRAPSCPSEPARSGRSGRTIARHAPCRRLSGALTCAGAPSPSSSSRSSPPSPSVSSCGGDDDDAGGPATSVTSAPVAAATTSPAASTTPATTTPASSAAGRRHPDRRGRLRAGRDPGRSPADHGRPHVARLPERPRASTPTASSACSTRRSSPPTTTSPTSLGRDDLVDPGFQFDPNVEQIAAAEPDLIVAPFDQIDGAPALDAMRQIAPVLVVPTSDTRDPAVRYGGTASFQDWRTTLRAYGAVLDRIAGGRGVHRRDRGD